MQDRHRGRLHFVRHGGEVDLHIARFGIYLNLRIFMYNICSNFPRISTLDSWFNVRLIARPHIDSNINVSKLSEKLIYFARFSRQNNRIVVLHNMLPPLNILTLIIDLPIHILDLPTRHYPSLKNDFQVGDQRYSRFILRLLDYVYIWLQMNEGWGYLQAK